MAVLEQILREDGQAGLPKLHKALLEEVIYQVYQSSAPATPTLSDLKKLLEKHPSSEMRSYAQILFSWTGDTAYGKLLDGATNIDLKRNLITIEVKGLDSYPDLQNVMLLNFAEFIKTEAAQG